MRQTDKTSNLKVKFCLFLLLFSGVFYTAFYYGSDFLGVDALDDGIYEEVDSRRPAALRI